MTDGQIQPEGAARQMRPALLGSGTLQLIYFAQMTDPEWYAKTMYVLFDAQSPPVTWSYDDPRFQAALAEFQTLFITRFGEMDQEIIDNTVPRDTVENLIQEYEQHLSQKKLREGEAAILARDLVSNLQKQGVRLSERERLSILNRFTAKAEGSFATASSEKDFARTMSGEVAAGLGSYEGIGSANQPEVTEAAISPVISSAWKSFDHERTKREMIVKSTLIPQDGQQVTHRPDVYAGIYRTLADESVQKSPDALQALGLTASKLTLAAEPIMTAAAPEGRPEISQTFIKSLARPGFEGPVGALASFMDPKTRESVSKTLLSRSFERIMGNTEALSERLGGGFVSSELFRFIADKTTAGLAVGSQGSAVGGAAGSMASLAGSILTGPFGTVALNDPGESLLTFLETASLGNRMSTKAVGAIGKASAPLVGSAALSAIMPREFRRALSQPNFDIRLMLGDINLRRSPLYGYLLPTAYPIMANSAALSQGVMGVFNRSGLGAALFEPYLSQITRMYAGSGPVSALPYAYLRYIPKNLVNNPVSYLPLSPGLSIGQAARLLPMPGVVTRLLGGAVFGFGGLLGTFGSGLLGFALRLGGLGTSRKEEERVMLMALAAGLIPVLFIFITAMDPLQVRDIALASQGIGIPFDIGQWLMRYSPGSSPACPSNIDPPEYTGPWHCPVDNGVYVRGPAEHGYPAFDIDKNFGADILATHDGYVVGFSDGMADYNYVYMNYGNWIEIAGKKSECGGVFVTLYAHLKNGSIPQEIKDKMGTEELVSAGDKIGEMDATGYTYGNDLNGTGIHLHYEYHCGSNPSCLQLAPECR